MNAEVLQRIMFCGLRSRHAMRRLLLGVMGFAMTTLFLSDIMVAQAQSSPPATISAGLLAGPTSGLTLKALFQEPKPGSTGAAVDLNVSFNGQGFLQLSGHALRENDLPDTPLRLFLGSGMAAELDDGTLRWGLSTSIGGYFLRGPYEILFQLIPRLMVSPERDGSFGAAVGLRYRF